MTCPIPPNYGTQLPRHHTDLEISTHFKPGPSRPWGQAFASAEFGLKFFSLKDLRLSISSLSFIGGVYELGLHLAQFSFPEQVFNILVKSVGLTLLLF